MSTKDIIDTLNRLFNRHLGFKVYKNTSGVFLETIPGESSPMHKVVGNASITYRLAEPDGELTTPGEMMLSREWKLNLKGSSTLNEFLMKIQMMTEESLESGFLEHINPEITYDPVGDSEVERFKFEGCVNITRAELFPGTTVVHVGAFSKCRNLEYISIPDTVTRVADLAFFGCDSLSSVKIPPGVSALGYNTFRKCANLRRVELPKFFENCYIGKRLMNTGMTVFFV